MANDKKFVTKNGLLTQNAEFVDVFGSNTQSIILEMDDTGTLSFSGSNGQLFSVTDDMTGVIFSVNDMSGVPSIEVDDDGTIRLAELFGNVLIGTDVDDGINKLQVNGDVTLSNDVYIGNDTTIDGDILLSSGSVIRENPSSSTNNIIMFPEGGMLDDNRNPATGYLKITLPVQATTPTMLKFDLDYYEYYGGSAGSSAKMQIGGYMYTSGPNWINVVATITTARTDRYYTVKFGHDGTNYCIWIGDATFNWYYPKFVISNLIIGFSGGSLDKWRYGWSMSIDPTEPASVYNTAVAVNMAYYALNAGLLDNIDSSQFLRSDADDTASGALTLTYGSGYALTVNSSAAGKILVKGSTDPNMVFQETDVSKGLIQWISATNEFRFHNYETLTGIRVKEDLYFENDGTEYLVYHEGNFTGGGGAEAGMFFENDITLTTNYTITTSKNAMSAGPITIATGVTVTIPSGSTWTIV